MDKVQFGISHEYQTRMSIRNTNSVSSGTIAYMGPDPENENEDMKGVISPDEWFYMGPGELPSGILYNILYGQEYVQSGQKILLLRGISNGQEMEMEFKRKDGEWMLTAIHL